ncbi:D-beta-D-heptose 7-phosphate kinase / D-beta-D-heptose 1-phosphate adenylyltransferase [Azospirillaceae bacterium]
MTDLIRHIHALSGTPVLCVGDVMLDRFVYGAVDRISPEAPIPILRIEREAAMLGGAGNVAANLHALGAEVFFLSVVGDDEAGDSVRRLASVLSHGDSVALVVEPGRQTTVKTRFVAAHQQLLRSDCETTGAISIESATVLLAAARARLERVAAVVLSDYGKGVLTEHVTAALIEMARAAGKPVVVDPKGDDYRRYRGAAVVTPNRKELSLAVGGRPVGTDEQVSGAAAEIITVCGVDAVVATRSEQGLSVFASEQPPVHLPAEAREVFDVSGAGDTVIATLATALGAGASLVDAARLANIAGGVVVGKVGTAVVRVHDLLSALHQQEWNIGESKVLAAEEAVERLDLWRRRNLKVGFTNGCFDLLHPGHLSLITQARTACDRLVVGLNSDESVRRLKGAQRPIQTESARATVLASLAMVDLVVIFDEDTPLSLIKILRPDVLVKGADYRLDQVVGADVVQSYGGRVVLADLQAGFSTTSTIARINAPKL